MKVLMLLENSIPGDIRVENELTSLIASGHQVTVLCTGTMTYPYKGATIIGKVIPWLIKKSFIAHPWFPMYENWWRKRVFEILTKQNFDVIHVHDLPLARLGYEMARLRNIPFILDLHENYPALLKNATHTRTVLGRLLHSDKAWRRFEREYVQAAWRVITVCSEAESRLLIEYPLHGFQVYVVQNTPDIKNFPSVAYRKNTDGVLKIIYCGGLNRHRGLQTLIEAVRIIYNEMSRTVYVRIVGEGSYKSALIKQASSLPTQLITFTGKVDIDDMFRMILESHVAIIPHLRNYNNDASSPHKIFQYMYAGVPVIASDCPSIKRLIDEVRCGYIFPSGNAMALASLIRKIDGHRGMLELGVNGTNAVIDKYNWENDAKELINLYKTLL